MDLKEGWRLEKTVNVGHILTTLVIGISLFAWINTIEKRITTLEVAERYNSDDFSEIKASLRRIEDKLDRKADK